MIGAAEQGAALAATWLLQHGANVDKASEGGPSGNSTPLWIACENGFLRMVRLLLDHGANVDTFKTNTGNTALYIAAQNGHEAICSELIRRGAQLELTKGSNPPPLGAAVGCASAPVVALLRNAGATVQVRYFGTIGMMKLTGKTPMDKHA